MKDKIPYGKQNITQSDINSVIESLKGEFLTQGPLISDFEENFNTYVDSKHSIAVSNGTAALHLSILALGLKPGEKVICPTLSFAASANCIKYAGGEVIFCDIDPETYLINLEHLTQLLEKYNDVKGVVVVNFAGRVVDTEKVKKLSNQYNFWILEDACHSPGGFFFNSKGEEILAGSCRYSDISIFSFHPVKHICAGEGGMITTNNNELYQRCLRLRTHGITKSEAEYINSPEEVDAFFSKTEYPSWYYEMQMLGYNYRITDFQCALGLSQLKRANESLEKRREIAKKYDAAFQNKPYILNHSRFYEGHAYHLYVIEVNRRTELYEFLKLENIFTQVHYFPIHLMPFYKGLEDHYLPFSEKYKDYCLSIPMYPDLNDNQINHVIQKIKEFYE